MGRLYKIALLLIFLNLLCFNVQAQRKFRILGYLPFVRKQVEVLLTSDNPLFEPLKTKCENGRFILKGTINQEYEHVYLTVKEDDQDIGSWEFFVKEGNLGVNILRFKHGKLEGEIKYTDIPFVDEQKEYEILLRPLSDSLNYKGNSLYQAKHGFIKGYNEDSLLKEIGLLQAEKLALEINYLKNIPHSYFGLYLFKANILNNLHLSVDSLVSIYSNFDQSIRETYLGKIIEELIRKKQLLLINRIAPDFTFITNKGEQYLLSSFRNKNFILLCFWDSWCGPCIKSIPFLKNIASQYEANGLRLLSVSVDNNEEKWSNSLNKYNLPWLQTCNLSKYIKEKDLQVLYDINYIPQYFLLDKNGRIIYQNFQSGDQDDYRVLKATLAKLFH